MQGARPRIAVRASTSGALECLSMAAICVCAAVNRIIGGAPGGVALKDSAKRDAALSDWTNAGFRSSTFVK